MMKQKRMAILLSFFLVIGCMKLASDIAHWDVNSNAFSSDFFLTESNGNFYTGVDICKIETADRGEGWLYLVGWAVMDENHVNREVYTTFFSEGEYAGKKFLCEANIRSDVLAYFQTLPSGQPMFETDTVGFSCRIPLADLPSPVTEVQLWCIDGDQQGVASLPVVKDTIILFNS